MTQKCLTLISENHRKIQLNFCDHLKTVGQEAGNSWHHTVFNWGAVIVLLKRLWSVSEG